ncbi:hypothetical protein DYBT9623_01714 [Dyadobacter sp. CECT 9623]|uniref:Uncharacterized protein n=2 Tax=Dyadobacter linearis TaxID=2823330 RepID=A0ABN7R4C7_9BACT|nr:hypothetical protein DYBT9623_01714 [Dyadobacter sp. CECT 9623]
MEAKLINIAIDQARTALTSQFMVLQSQFDSITPNMLKTSSKESRSRTRLTPANKF